MFIVAICQYVVMFLGFLVLLSSIKFMSSRFCLYAGFGMWFLINLSNKHFLFASVFGFEDNFSLQH